MDFALTTEQKDIQKAAREFAEGEFDRDLAIELERSETFPRDIVRKGATFTFREVQIDGDGWLVMHPFKNGKPVGVVYVGATYIKDGVNRDVEINVEEEPAPGTRFLVMLHLDVNENQEFDFVFVDERNVLDKAVFEGTTMIAHPIAAP